MEKFTPKLIEKAKTAKSVEELLAIAEENEVVLALDEVKTYFEQLNPPCGELDDDELDNVSGGGCETSPTVSMPNEAETLSVGRAVSLCNSGHTFGSAFCMNSVCASKVFRIAKQIDAEKYLLECMGCDWTYHAVKENIKPV